MKIGLFGPRMVDEGDAARIALETATDFTIVTVTLAIDGASALAIGQDGRIVLIRAAVCAFDTHICTNPSVRVVEQLQFGGRLEIDAGDHWQDFRIDLTNRWEAYSLAAQLTAAAAKLS